MVCGYAASGLFCILLPAAAHLSAALGFICLCIVISVEMGANVCVVALATSTGRGAALCFNLALFNSIGNSGGFLGSVMLGVFLKKTCSFSAACIIMGVITILGGLLPLLVPQQSQKGAGHGSWSSSNGADMHRHSVTLELAPLQPSICPTQCIATKNPWVGSELTVQHDIAQQ